tara:strand:- start:1586 stop:2338 length:753 start_codon:yes stop_codon:yes gene_type:complete
MIVGLQIGKEKSTSRPGKNYMKLLGRQLNEYSLLAAYHCKEIEKIYISTDSPAIKSSANKFNAKVIDRPAELATPEALTEDVLTHAYNIIVDDLGEKPEMVVLLFANTPTLNLKKLQEGIKILRNQLTLDSCFSVVKYNMFSPTRSKLLSDGILKPFVDPKVFGEISSIRSSQGDVYFADLTIQIMRPVCFENMDEGTPPLQWMGKKTYGLEVDFGFDFDEEWQLPVIEYWLRKHGFTEIKTPYGTNKNV